MIMKGKPLARSGFVWLRKADKAICGTMLDLMEGETLSDYIQVRESEIPAPRNTRRSKPNDMEVDGNVI